MARKLAIRRLQLSETTFFQPGLEKVQREARAAGKKKGSAQKAVNLDRRIFVDKFYPRLMGRREEFEVNLTVSGPNDNRTFITTRPISKPEDKEVERDDAQRTKSSKNWRLHGATIRNPSSDPHRYDGIAVDDFMLMEFVDDARGNPGALNAQLITRDFAREIGIEADLDALFPTRWNMEVITEEQLAALSASTRALPVNPLAIFDIDETQLLEAAAAGQQEAVVELHRHRRNISREELLRAQASRDSNGVLGELLTILHLQGRQDAGEIHSYLHVASISATNPYDFEADLVEGGPIYIDAKTTSGNHVRDFHMSSAELAFAAGADRPYHIYRLSQLRNSRAVIRISNDIRKLARSLTIFFAGMPEGVSLESVALSPSLLEWSAPAVIEFAGQVSTDEVEES